MTKDQFTENFLSVFVEEGLQIDENSKFKLIPDYEEGKKHNSIDDVARLWAFHDLSLEGEFSLKNVLAVLTVMFPHYPLWVHIFQEGDCFAVNFSMRFRKPSQLRYQESGKSPFKFVREAHSES